MPRECPPLAAGHALAAAPSNLDKVVAMAYEHPADTPAESPFPIVTVTLLAANILVFIGCVLSGMDWFRPNVDTLVALGANTAPLTLTGEKYRLFSSIFLHGGLDHLVANMYMLLIIGILAERSFGRLPFALIYLASGVWGSLVSALWSNHHDIARLQTVGHSILAFDEGLRLVVSVGASGAIMGITGACLAARWAETTLRAPSEHRLAGTGKSIAQVLALNLVLGMVFTQIDQAAHVGGVLAGMPLGAVLFLAFRQNPGKRLALALGLGALSVVSASALADRTPSDQLQAVRKVMDEEAAQRPKPTAPAAPAASRQEADTADDPPEVSDAEAAGKVIDLHLKMTQHFQVSADGKRLYVTSGQDNLLKIVDLEGKAPDRIIKGKPWPAAKKDGCPHNMCRGYGASGFAISKDERYAYVASMSLDAVSIIDLTADRVVATIPVGRYPRIVMLSADEKYAFAMNGPDNSYSVIDLAARTAVAPPVVLKGGEAAGAFGRPLSAWMSNNGTVANFYDDTSNTVATYDTRNPGARKDIPLGDVWSNKVVPIDDQKWLLHARDGLLIHDLKKDETRIEFLTCSGEFTAVALAVSPDRSLLAMAGYQGDIVLIRLSTGRAIARYPGEGAAGLRFSDDGKTLYALGTDGRFSILDVGKSASLDPEARNMYCRPEEQ